ncbi:MAG TPA: hypothetical protein VH639_15955 [Bryobacteraceae bacterium]|jgi:hypothetical protein
MESASAHDKLGLATIQFGHDARQALAEFSQAIELVGDGMSRSDGEWAELHWHRAAAEQQVGQSLEAYRDFELAEGSLAGAAKGLPAYRALLSQIVKEHASMLEEQGRREEAEALLAQIQ